jgi:hypothetical protein
MSDDHDPIAELERLDRFFDGEEEGECPIDVLRARGITIPDGASLDDESLRAKLWHVINAMASIGMYLDSTDHMSDRELYRYLVTNALCHETILPVGGSDSDSGWHISPIGGGSEEDNDVYLRYYADDDIRQHWLSSFGEPIPPKEKPPWDRDRLLPQHAAHSDERVQ